MSLGTQGAQYIRSMSRQRSGVHDRWNDIRQTPSCW